MTQWRAGGVSPLITETAYDAEGRVSRITSPEGTVNYEHDPLGRRVRTFTGTAADPVNDFRYEYDALDRLTNVTVWERNDVPLPASGRETTEYEYDLLGNLDLERKPNGIVTDYLYDALSRLDKLTHYSPDATPNDLSDNPKLAEFDYTVRADGKRTQVDEYRSGNQTGTFRWEYDAVGRLVDEVFDSYEDNALDYTARYAFDLNGNRLEKSLWKTAGTVSGTPDEHASYTYDANDRLLEETLDLLVGSDKETTYAWGSGNVATYQTGKSVTDLAASQLVEQTAYSYNLQGRLSQAVIEKFTGGQLVQRDTSTFTYGDDGIRVTATHKIEADNNGTPATLEVTSDTRTTFLNDSQNHTGYSQVLVETTLDNLAAGAILKTVISTLGHDLLAQTTVTDPQGNPSDLTFHLLYDGHGSTRLLTDAAAQIASVSGVPQIFNYDAYGNAVGFTPATAATNFLYSGEQFDQRLAMQYLRARYYDSHIGRFMRLDPHMGRSNTPLSLHKYSYASGDPRMFVDPSGEMSLTSVLTTISIGIPLVSAVANYSLMAYHAVQKELAAAFLYQVLGHVDLFTAGLAALNIGTGGGAGGVIVVSGGALMIRRLAVAAAAQWAVKNGATIGLALAVPALSEAVIWLRAMLMSAPGGGPPRGTFEHVEGPGSWYSGAESYTGRATKFQEFQAKVSGKPNGWIYWLGGKKWDGVRTATKELLDAKSASGNDFYVRAIMQEASSIGRAYRRTGGYQGDVDTLRIMGNIAAENGYKAVIECETEGVRQAFHKMVQEEGIQNVFVRVYQP